MAHYAFLDENNIVTEVITGRDEDDLAKGVTSWEDYYGAIRGQRCVRTSYNGNIRYNYAGIGYTYDEARDAFIPAKPYESWILNEDTCLWGAPVERPAEGDWVWDEQAGAWVEV